MDFEGEGRASEWEAQLLTGEEVVVHLPGVAPFRAPVVRVTERAVFVEDVRKDGPLWVTLAVPRRRDKRWAKDRRVTPVGEGADES